MIKLAWEQFRIKPDYLVILVSITATKLVSNTQQFSTYYIHYVYE